MPILKEHGWVKLEGKNKQHLVVCKLCSHTNNRNIRVDMFCYDSFTEVYRSLRAFLALIIQSHKDFIKRTIQIATNPKRGQNFMAARKLVKRLVRQGVLNTPYDTYKEYGLSLKRIAKETGNCIRTAQRIMQYAQKKKWCKVKHHPKQVYSPKIYFREIEGYMFSTKNNLYRVYANTYTLNRRVAMAVSEADWLVTY